MWDSSNNGIKRLAHTCPSVFITMRRDEITNHTKKRHCHWDNSSLASIQRKYFVRNEQMTLNSTSEWKTTFTHSNRIHSIFVYAAAKKMSFVSFGFGQNVVFNSKRNSKWQEWLSESKGLREKSVYVCCGKWCYKLGRCSQPTMGVHIKFNQIQSSKWLSSVRIHTFSTM